MLAVDVLTFVLLLCCGDDVIHKVTATRATYSFISGLAK